MLCLIRSDQPGAHWKEGNFGRGGNKKSIRPPQPDRKQGEKMFIHKGGFCTNIGEKSDLVALQMGAAPNPILKRGKKERKIESARTGRREGLKGDLFISKENTLRGNLGGNRARPEKSRFVVLIA